MKKVSLYFLAVLFAGVFASCSDDEDEVLPITMEQATSKAMAATSGTVIASTTTTTAAGVTYFEIDVKTSSGAIIEFEYYQEDGSLKGIEGDQGPFDYEVDPGMGLIKFSAAKDAALNAQPGEVLRWSLKEEFPDVWIYTFEVLASNGEEFEVGVNAQTGAAEVK
ncbi:PepSY domain-containing protein [Marivirga sp.]|uniref:PepSY domain-containing protein n=1 Tax=Marivirga sp. TaxID=2018662 RepID=UPI0025E5E1F3|nr:PepSY domain-containing protein [Marivirga sp.]